MYQPTCHALSLYPCLRQVWPRAPTSITWEPSALAFLLTFMSWTCIQASSFPLHLQHSSAHLNNFPLRSNRVTTIATMPQPFEFGYNIFFPFLLQINFKLISAVAFRNPSCTIICLTAELSDGWPLRNVSNWPQFYFSLFWLLIFWTPFFLLFPRWALCVCDSSNSVKLKCIFFGIHFTISTIKELYFPCFFLFDVSLTFPRNPFVLIFFATGCIWTKDYNVCDVEEPIRAECIVKVI